MAQPPRAYRKVVFSGVVQGVGFRPTLKKIADETGVEGWVLNAGGLAECALRGAPDAVDRLIGAVQARFSILKSNAEAIAPFEADGFRILESREAPSDGALPALVPPDAPVCDDCLREMRDPHDRRYRHPFISCSACGPRYSILRALPYDRENTTMDIFTMCAACASEYREVSDRRLHAQTVACPDCGPCLAYSGSGSDEEDPIDRAARDILAGGIVAVKGIGGYHLCCLPEWEPVERLRALKGRERKPFAVMFGDIADIEAVCEVNPEERRLLLSFARPIVLLPVKSPAFSANVAQGSLEYGCFLPYTPVHHLLLNAVAGRARALVMTSANRSGEPILFEDEKIPAFAAGRLAGTLAHDRRIENPLDDSVARVIDGEIQILRRARGYAPLPIPLTADGASVFAAGGDLKASFCVLRSDYAYVGAHIGDLEDAGCFERYGYLARNLAALLDARPGKAACDLHPRYFSASYARDLRLPLTLVQHHHAHIGSVMAEHGLARVLGVAFDGTGYGTDGSVWGGEFLLCEGAAFERAGHLLPVLMAGGDESMRDAVKTAACYQWASRIAPDGYPGWAVLKRALALRVNTVRSSSAGRLFDAASAVLGICRENRYEGECAILLEREATLARRARIEPAKLAFGVIEEDGRLLADWRPVIRALSKKGDVRALALGFHEAVAEMVERVCAALCERRGISDVALSGGVFQNRLLTEMCLEKLRARGLRVYINRQVPPGDGGISLGQAFIASR